MKVTAICPRCFAATRFSVAEAPPALACVRCGDRREIAISDRMREGMIDVCALCGCGHFYLEKDFNSWLGGAIIVVAVAGFLWAQSFNILLAFGFLGAAAAFDLAMYVARPMRTICYKCLATYRGACPNPQHKEYELGVAGRFADDYEDRKGE